MKINHIAVKTQRNQVLVTLLLQYIGGGKKFFLVEKFGWNFDNMFFEKENCRRERFLLGHTFNHL